MNKKIAIFAILLFVSFIAYTTKFVSAEQIIKCTCCDKCKCVQRVVNHKVICDVCHGKCQCCSKCRCYRQGFDRTYAKNAGDNNYIIVGKAEKDGPYYIINLANGKKIKMDFTGDTKLYPSKISPEKLPKVLVKYKNDLGNYRALQIFDANQAHIKQVKEKGQVIYRLEENTTKKAK